VKNLRISPHFGWAKILLQLGHFFLSSNFKEYLQAFFTQPIFYHCAKADLSNLADKDVLDDKDGLGRPDQPCQQQWIPPIFVDIGTALSFCAIFLIHIAVPVGTGTYVSLITGFLDDRAKLYLLFSFSLKLAFFTSLYIYSRRKLKERVFVHGPCTYWLCVNCDDN